MNAHVGHCNYSTVDKEIHFSFSFFIQNGMEIKIDTSNKVSILVSCCNEQKMVVLYMTLTNIND